MTTSLIVLNENSFVSLTEANAYFATRLNSTVWDSASDANKEKALIQATRQINSFDFISEKTIETQALKFPRYVCGLSQTPDGIKNGTCEQALYLLNGGDKYKDFQRSNVKSISMGKESVTFGAENADLLCFEARVFVDGWIKKGFNFAVGIDESQIFNYEIDDDE